MSRFTNPVPQYFDSNGDPLCFGLLYYYDSGTNTAKNTFADSLLTIANTNPVELDAAGRVPNIFYSGSARVVLKDCDNQQIWDEDPVGGESEFADFSEWSESVIYSSNDLIEYNNLFYRSLTNDNQGNTPSSTPSSNEDWVQVTFVELYNSTLSYSIGATVKTTDGSMWRSVVAANLGNEPTADDGSNWLPSVDGSKVPEVIALELFDTESLTSIPQTGGGALTALRINELQDAGAYTLPLASTVSANQYIDIELPSEFATSEPTVSRAGSDTITWRSGTDTTITFDGGSISLRLYSDGISDWRL